MCIDCTQTHTVMFFEFFHGINIMLDKGAIIYNVRRRGAGMVQKTAIFPLLNVINALT